MRQTCKRKPHPTTDNDMSESKPANTKKPVKFNPKHVPEAQRPKVKAEAGKAPEVLPAE